MFNTDDDDNRGATGENKPGRLQVCELALQQRLLLGSP